MAGRDGRWLRRRCLHRWRHPDRHLRHLPKQRRHQPQSRHRGPWLGSDLFIRTDTASITNNIFASPNNDSVGGEGAAGSDNLVVGGAHLPDRHQDPGADRQHRHLALDAAQITIDGVGFDPIAANDTVTFNDGAIGTVTAATFNSLTVKFSTGAEPRPAALTAIVTADGVSSGAAVQVATLTPVLTASTADLAASATQITIKGLGFDPTAASDTVTFNDGAVGTVTTASTTSLTVTFSTEPTTAGSLTAIVTTDSVNSGAAVQVATVTPVVSVQHGRPGRQASQITINGSASARPPPMTRSRSTTAPPARSRPPARPRSPWRSRPSQRPPAA